MCHSFLPVFNSTSDVFCVLQKSYARQVKLSCQPYVYYICKQYAAAGACSARNLPRHFWAAYARTRVNLKTMIKYIKRMGRRRDEPAKTCM